MAPSFAFSKPLPPEQAYKPLSAREKIASLAQRAQQDREDWENQSGEYQGILEFQYDQAQDHLTNTYASVMLWGAVVPTLNFIGILAVLSARPSSPIISIALNTNLGAIVGLILYQIFVKHNVASSIQAKVAKRESAKEKTLSAELEVFLPQVSKDIYAYEPMPLEKALKADEFLRGKEQELLGWYTKTIEESHYQDDSWRKSIEEARLALAVYKLQGKLIEERLQVLNQLNALASEVELASTQSTDDCTKDLEAMGNQQ